MKFNLRVVFSDGRIIDPVTVTIADMLRFEEKFNVSVTSLSGAQKLSHIVFLAWCALTRLKQTEKGYEEFTETISEVSSSEIDPK